MIEYFQELERVLNTLAPSSPDLVPNDKEIERIQRTV